MADLQAFVKDARRVAQFQWEIGKCLELGEPAFTTEDVEKLVALLADRDAALAALQAEIAGLRTTLDALADAVHDHGLQGDIVFHRPYRRAMGLLKQTCGCRLCVEVAARYAAP